MQEHNRKYLTDGEAVELAIRAVINEPARVISLSADESVYFQKRAAFASGYQPPFTAEQRALNSSLTKHKAGKSSCEKAWKLYHFLRM